MDDERHYGNHTSHSDDQRYGNFVGQTYKSSTTTTYDGGKETRNGNIGNHQRRTRDSGVKLKRCPPYLLGKPLSDFDRSEDHQVKWYIAMWILYTIMGFGKSFDTSIVAVARSEQLNEIADNCVQYRSIHYLYSQLSLLAKRVFVALYITVN